MSQRKNQRRQLVVDKTMQQRIVVACSWPPALALFVSTAALCYFCTRLAHESRLAGVQLDNLFPVLATALAFSVTATAFVIVSALRFSHKVAGPMFAMGRALEAVTHGEATTRVNLREGDFLQPLAEQLNNYLESVDRTPEAPTKGQTQPNLAAPEPTAVSAHTDAT